MAAMLRSAYAGLVLRRSSESLRLPSCLSAVSFSDHTAAGRIRRHMDESDKEEAEEAQRGRNKQRHGFSNGQQSDSFYTTYLDDIKLPRGSSTDSAKTSSSVESSTDTSSRSSGGFWDRKSSWSWGSGDSGGWDSCGGGGDSCGGD